MIFKILVGLLFQSTHLIILIIYLIGIIKTLNDRNNLKSTQRKKTKSPTYDKYKEYSLSNLRSSKHNLLLMILVFIFDMIFHLIMTLNFFRLISLLSQKNIFLSFFDFKNKKSVFSVDLQKVSSDFFIGFFILSLIKAFIPFFYAQIFSVVLVFSFWHDLKIELIDILKKGVPIYKVILVYATLKFILLLISFCKSAFYIFVSTDASPTNSLKCNRILKEHFDYVFYYPKSKVINCMNGVMFHKSIIIFVGDFSVFSEDEIYAIILHEIGHGGKKGIYFFSFFTLLIHLSVIVFFYYLSCFFVYFYFNEEEGLALLFTIAFASVINIITEFITNFYSFFVEYKADYYSFKKGYGEYLISGLMIMSRINFGMTRMNYFSSLLVTTHPYVYYRALKFDKFVVKNNKV